MLKTITDKIWSRKLAAFLAACIGLWLGVVDQNTWETVAVAYLGSQGLVDIADRGMKAMAAKAKGTAVAASDAGDGDDE